MVHSKELGAGQTQRRVAQGSGPKAALLGEKVHSKGFGRHQAKARLKRAQSSLLEGKVHAKGFGASPKERQGSRGSQNLKTKILFFTFQIRKLIYLKLYNIEVVDLGRGPTPV